MPKTILTDTAIRALKPKDKPYKVSDGKTGGMFITVSPKGKKAFRLAYKFQGKAQRLTLGAYPECSLEEARDAKNSLPKAQTLPQPKKQRKPKSWPEKAHLALWLETGLAATRMGTGNFG